MNCDRRDCKETARWQLGWRAWARGYPKTSVPIESYLSLAVCDDHKAGTTMKDIVTPEASARVNNELQRLGRAPLDFDGAEPIFHEIIDGKLFMPGREN